MDDFANSLPGTLLRRSNTYSSLGVPGLYISDAMTAREPSPPIPVDSMDISGVGKSLPSVAVASRYLMFRHSQS